MPQSTAILHRLARSYDIQPSYRDVAGRRCPTPPDALVAMLRIMGAPIHDASGAADAVREVRLQRWRSLAEPVHVVWDDAPAHLPLRVASSPAAGRLQLSLRLESGESCQWNLSLEGLPALRQRRVEGQTFQVRQLALPPSLPWGYHRLSLALGPAHSETLIIRAPRQAYQGRSPEARLWGVFLPLYSLWRQDRRCVANLSDLNDLMSWIGLHGGSIAATLPLLAGSQWQADNPSPYSPTSRLFWNDLYVDAAQTDEFARTPAARSLLEEHRGTADGPPAPRPPLVDFRRELAVQEEVLRQLAATFFEAGGDTARGEFEEFLRRRPEVRRFARFRAAERAQGQCWLFWPEPMRQGRLEPGDFDPADERMHLYAQWQAERQMAAIAHHARSAEMLLYLDLPLGVDRGSFDVWQHRDAFVLEASGGAPPDAFQPTGQDWGFAPLHPQRLRRRGYDYQIAVLRHHLRHGQLLRLDHVMSLERLFWVPQGADARSGAYIRYPREELLAIVALESQRHRAFVVGENLGTVPAGFNAAIQRHGIGELYVMQYELESIQQHPPRPAAGGAAAGLNTHDMPPFAAFWSGSDIDDRLEQGKLSPPRAQAERVLRRRMRDALAEFLRRHGLLPQPPAESPSADRPAAGPSRPDAPPAAVATVLEACLTMLASSDARFVLVSLEDLWHETRPQNRPGYLDAENWRRLARRSFEDFLAAPDVLRLLELVDHYRRHPATHVP